MNKFKLLSFFAMITLLGGCYGVDPNNVTDVTNSTTFFYDKHEKTITWTAPWTCDYAGGIQEIFTISANDGGSCYFLRMINDIPSLEVTLLHIGKYAFYDKAYSKGHSYPVTYNKYESIGLGYWAIPLLFLSGVSSGLNQTQCDYGYLSSCVRMLQEPTQEELANDLTQGGILKEYISVTFSLQEIIDFSKESSFPLKISGKGHYFILDVPSTYFQGFLNAVLSKKTKE